MYLENNGSEKKKTVIFAPVFDPYRLMNSDL
jgi:hypothetical protein